jgi:hypothetical protein
MRGAIPLHLNTPSWRCAQLKTQEQLYLYLQRMGANEGQVKFLRKCILRVRSVRFPTTVNIPTLVIRSNIKQLISDEIMFVTNTPKCLT